MECRGNSLNLNWRNRICDTDKLCPLCKEEIENLNHFLLRCQKLQSIRNTCLHLQFLRESNCNEGFFLSLILLFENDHEYDKEFYINLVNKLWLKRNEIIKVDQ